MLIAARILDILTVAIAIVLGLMLRKKWQARIAMVASGFVALLWCAYHRPPIWLGGVPPVLVDLATFGLAYLGGHVALNPPREADRNLKNIFVSSFALLFVIGMIANGWQRTIESTKQDGLQKNETDARNQFSHNMEDVKISNEAILNFVSHPPKGFTLEQITSVVRSYIGKDKTHDSPIDDLVKEVQAVTMAHQVAQGLMDWREDRKGVMDDTYKREYQEQEEYSHQHPNATQHDLDAIRKRWQDVRDKWDDDTNAKLKELISTADSVRKELRRWIPRIMPIDNTEEPKFTQALKDGTIDRRDAAAYLEDLVRRVPPPMPPGGQR